VRDKAIIDHLVKQVYDGKSPADEHTVHRSTTASGLSVEEQVRKAWDPSKGGLPIFCRD
jgi:hypothetical protein